jgi:hypothetical protein
MKQYNIAGRFCKVSWREVTLRGEVPGTGGGSCGDTVWQALAVEECTLQTMTSVSPGCLFETQNSGPSPHILYWNCISTRFSSEEPANPNQGLYGQNPTPSPGENLSFCGTGGWTQGLEVASKRSATWATPSALLLYFVFQMGSLVNFALVGLRPWCSRCYLQVDGITGAWVAPSYTPCQIGSWEQHPAWAPFRCCVCLRGKSEKSLAQLTLVWNFADDRFPLLS